MKKITLIIVTLCISFFCIQVDAIDTYDTTITIDNIDVVFDSNTLLNSNERQVIAEYLVADPSEQVQTYGLMCNLFGHKNTTEIVYTITHEVNSTSPKCLRETWEITTCSRCNNTETTLINHYFVDCCP